MLVRMVVLMGLALVMANLAGCKTADKREVESGGDAAFMRAAAEGNIAEVEMGRVAMQRAASTEVKLFAQRMIDDHSAANIRLRQLANTKNIALPDDPNLSHRMMLDRLQGKDGADFDRAYMAHMVEDHQKDIGAYEKEVRDGDDPDVVAYAGSTLPTLREHLALGRRIAGRLGAETNQQVPTDICWRTSARPIADGARQAAPSATPAAYAALHKLGTGRACARQYGCHQVRIRLHDFVRLLPEVLVQTTASIHQPCDKKHVESAAAGECIRLQSV